MSISIKGVSKAFNKYPAVNDLSLTIPTGGFAALLGPSGSGKTTLLRLIAGLEYPDEGHIFFNGTDYTQKSVKERKVGFVFQHYALFKHMTIFENIAFGLRVKPRGIRPGKAVIREKVYELLKLVQLEETAGRYPSQLSGGQRQRIALARALAVEPEILLLDEPFGALDAKVRQDLRIWLRELHEKLNITTIFVTHDQEEALEMADEIVVMNEGRIEQTGSPWDVYHAPANPFVYSFLGRLNTLKDPAGITSYIRPHEVLLSASRTGSRLPAEVISVHGAGSTVRLHLRIPGREELLEAELSAEKYRELGTIERGGLIYADLGRAVFFEGNQLKSLSESCKTFVKI
ncbi:sulfate/molybdate ABC transporter ATP-binding protein [Peribacillus sp. SCS-37]|uniref:sulfate/molybdate ABC transporter ATP-binding protein n=1 Tax=Paraperibacillus esterisolvens TaxID=3115296 RepID=UPI003905921D